MVKNGILDQQNDERLFLLDNSDFFEMFDIDFSLN